MSSRKLSQEPDRWNCLEEERELDQRRKAVEWEATKTKTDKSHGSCLGDKNLECCGLRRGIKTCSSLTR